MNDNSMFDKIDTPNKTAFIGFVSEYWLDDGSKGLVLLSEEGDECYVMPNKQADRLQAFVDTEVVVTGYVTIDEGGDAFIEIKGFETMEDEDDFEYYDDDYDYIAY